VNPTDPATYITYLLRLWPVEGPSEQTWRASLENPRTGERAAFRDLPALFAYLNARTGDLIDGRQSASGTCSDALQPSSTDPTES
jgi:hypothetical protein